MKNNNKGFSLVELIIVIAIMAILVGIMAPQLIKYIEKTNVSSDKQFLDTIYQSLTYAIVDSEVQEDEKSRNVIYGWKDNTIYSLSSLESAKDTVLYKELTEKLGLANLSKSTYMPILRSAHASSADIFFCCEGWTVKAVWISTTDSSGKKDTSHTPTGLNDLGICIYVNRLTNN